MNDISLTNTRPRSLVAQINPETNGLITLGGRRGWDFAVLGRAPMPKKPVRLGDWLIVPAHQDSSEIPKRAMERVQTIFAEGLRPKGFVLVHEAPMLLPAPEEDEPQIAPTPFSPTPTKPFIPGLASVLVVGVAALAAIASVILPAALLVGAALVDPILIAVTEDDVWIEIDRWYS
ncbi:MAG: hypothetical protein PVF83_11605 [Anaerolineales bacterium]